MTRAPSVPPLSSKRVWSASDTLPSWLVSPSNGALSTVHTAPTSPENECLGTWKKKWR
jgi:hypothetical protein